MKNLLRHVSLVMVFILLFSFCSCGEKADKENTVPSSSANASDVYGDGGIFDTSFVHKIEVTISEDDWNDLIKNPLNKTKYETTVKIDGDTVENVSFATKGNTSLSMVASTDSDRYSFKLNFGKFKKGQTYKGIDKLNLNNIMSDATYMKDYISYMIMREAGVKAPLASYSTLYINGTLHGLYIIIENISESYLDHNYENGEGVLYKPESKKLDNLANPGGQTPDGSMPQMPDGQFPGGQMPDGSMPQDPGGQFPGGQTPDGSMPQMPDGQFPGGQMPDGSMPQDPGGQFPGGQTPDGSFPQIPDDQFPGGQTPDGSMPQTPDGSMQQDPGGQFPGGQMPDGSMQQDPGGQFPGGQMPGGGGFPGDSSGNNKGTDLVYTDDNEESYEAIFANAETDMTDDDKKELIAALKALSTGEDVDAHWDMDQVIRYFVAHNFVLNYDSYTGNMLHNYYLYENDGKVSILPWDYNLAFCGFMGSSDATSAVNWAIDSPLSGASEDQRPLWKVIVGNSAYLEKYHQYFDELIKDFFESGKCSAEIKRIYSLIKDYVKDDPTSFYKYEEFEKAYETLLKFCELRAESIRKQLDGTLGSTSSSQNKADMVDASDLVIRSMGSQGGDKGEKGGMDMPRGQNGGKQGNDSQRKPRRDQQNGNNNSGNNGKTERQEI